MRFRIARLLAAAGGEWELEREESESGSLRREKKKPCSIVGIYVTCDFLEVCPVVGLEVFVASGEVLSIGWGEAGERSQLGVVCHAFKSRIVVSSLVPYLPKIVICQKKQCLLSAIRWMVP